MRQEAVEIFVEIPKGSRNKYEFDKQKNQLVFDRMLFSSVHYPGDYGFIRETLAMDGDPLDAIVLVTEPTFPGCIIEARPVGLFIMHDEKGRDDKILCVPLYDPLWNHIMNLEQVPQHFLREIEHFFNIYKELENKKVSIEGWRGYDEAITIIIDSHDRYKRECRRRAKH